MSADKGKRLVDKMPSTALLCTNISHEHLSKLVKMKLHNNFSPHSIVTRLCRLRNAAGVVDINYWKGTLNPRPVVDW